MVRAVADQFHSAMLAGVAEHGGDAAAAPAIDTPGRSTVPCAVGLRSRTTLRRRPPGDMSRRVQHRTLAGHAAGGVAVNPDSSGVDERLARAFERA